MQVGLNYGNMYALKGHSHDYYIDKGMMCTGTQQRGKIPFVNIDGVMEVGRYIDMHRRDGESDYDIRLEVTDNNELYANKFRSNQYLGEDFALYANNANQCNIRSSKPIMFVSGGERVVLGANVHFDSKNDIHFDKNKGASQIVMIENGYPKYRWSNKGDPNYGIASWSSYHDILTSHDGQQVMMNRGITIKNGDNMNNYVNTGTYFVSSTTGTIINLPSNAYGYGILLVYKAGDVTMQVYFKDGQTTGEMYFRNAWGTNWRPWFRYFTNDQYNREEMTKELNSLNERIKILEDEIMGS